MRAIIAVLMLASQGCYVGTRVARVGEPLESIGLTVDAIPVAVFGALAANSLDEPHSAEFQISLSVFVGIVAADLIAKTMAD